MSFTLCLSYYNQPQMLMRQWAEWLDYPPTVRVIVVDDGSKEEAVSVLPRNHRADIYRITKDIPWNRNGARNLAAQVAPTEWILQTDLDHILPVRSAQWLAANLDRLNKNCWYRFGRFRVGKADDTRKKDVISPLLTFGSIKPHIDSFLITKELYWKAGGYNEDFSGSIGGSSPFLRILEKLTDVHVLFGCPLYVYTKHAVSDASVTSLSRDMTRYREIKQAKPSGKPPLRFEWEKVR